MVTDSNHNVFLRQAQEINLISYYRLSLVEDIHLGSSRLCSNSNIIYSSSKVEEDNNVVLDSARTVWYNGN